jgi:hypothetical protein
MSLKHFSAGDSVFGVACADILAFGVLLLLGGAALQRCDLRTLCERF